ncbi:MAG: hypothetical protein L3J19_01490 [Sulfurimonas sp.]|nr:hypothetical protein [Sulfurimonas sp.]
MKQYNTVILFILILITVSVSSYFFYLDIIYKDKLVKTDVESLYDLKRIAGKPIVEYANPAELEAKVFEYNQIILELNIDAIAQADKNMIVIRGAIHNSFSYILLKRLLNIVKNDEVNLISTCIGKECTEDDYGFLIKIRPYLLKLK